MSQVVFFNVPAYGHINPSLAVVQELVHRGENVRYYATEEFRDTIEPTGATFCSYGDIPNYDLSTISKNFMRLAAFLLKATQAAMPGVLEDLRASPPDYIMHDALCVWGKAAAQITDIPAITSIGVFAFNTDIPNISTNFTLQVAKMMLTGLPHMADFWRTGRALARTYDIERPSYLDVFNNHEPLNIVYTSRAFQPKADTFDERFKFVGPSIVPREEDTDFPFDQIDGGAPVIYISMGTIFNRRTGFYRACFNAFDNTPYRVVMSVGRQTNIDAFGIIPTNFIVRQYVPQLQVLQHTDLFITHGGMNSVHEGLYYGVPLVVIPQMAEQGLVAEQVVRVGAGVKLDKTAITAERLRETTVHVLSDPAFRRNSQHIGETLREAGGYERAVDEIFAFKAAHNL